jgi:uncharacterized membrane protein (DUF106 family)
MKFLFYLFVIGYVIRLVFPYLLRGFVSKQMEKAQQQMRSQQAYQQNAKQKEGDINIKNNAKTTKKDDFEGGEYVDFEEIK